MACGAEVYRQISDKSPPLIPPVRGRIDMERKRFFKKNTILFGGFKNLLYLCTRKRGKDVFIRGGKWVAFLLVCLLVP